MSTILPFGGRAILDVRMAGNRPTDMVCLSIVGYRTEGMYNPMCWINLGQHPSNFSFSFLRNLDVEIMASTARPFPDVIATVQLLSPIALGIYVSYPDQEVTVPVQLTTGKLCIMFPTCNMDSLVSRKSGKALHYALIKHLMPKMIREAA